MSEVDQKLLSAPKHKEQLKQNQKTKTREQLSDNIAGEKGRSKEL